MKLNRISPLLFVAALIASGVALGGALSYVLGPTYEKLCFEATQIEQGRAEQRHSNNLQLEAVHAKIDACLPAHLSQISQNVAKNDAFFRLSATEAAQTFERIANASEQACTTTLLNDVAVSNPKGAQALAALLLEQHYRLNHTYTQAAAKDAVALASVHF